MKHTALVFAFVACSPSTLQRETCLAKADAAFWHEVSKCEAENLSYDECEYMAQAEKDQDQSYTLCLEGD